MLKALELDYFEEIRNNLNVYISSLINILY